MDNFCVNCKHYFNDIGGNVHCKHPNNLYDPDPVTGNRHYVYAWISQCRENCKGEWYEPNWWTRTKTTLKAFFS